MSVSAAALPILVGCPRSGTTLLRVMVDSHPQIAVAPDAPHLIALARQHRYRGAPEPRALARGLARGGSFGGCVPVDLLRADFARHPPANFADAVRRCLQLYAEISGCPRAGIKTPTFVYHLQYLAALFPEARFLHLVRDGRDVAASMLARQPFTDDVVMAASMWRRAIVEGRRAGRQLGPDRYLEIRHEQLVAAPEEALGRVCAFLGLPFDERMLTYPSRPAVAQIPAEFAAHHDGLSRPPTPGLRDWRSELGTEQLVRFDVVAGRQLRTLGYPSTGLRATAPIRAGTSLRAATAWGRQRLRDLRTTLATRR